MKRFGRLCDIGIVRSPEQDAPDYECDLCAESGECDGACERCPHCNGNGCEDCGQ